MKVRVPAVLLRFLWPAVTFLLVLVAFMTVERWVPVVVGQLNAVIAAAKDGKSESGGGHEGHDDHAGHAHADPSTFLEVTDEAKKNLELDAETLKPVELKTFVRYLTIPAVLVERPGQTHIQITAPVTGVIQAVSLLRGQAVSSGTLLFRIRLTHGDLITAQTEFLKTAGELDVVQQDLKLLNQLTQGLAPMKKRERQFQQQKLQKLLKAQAAGLRLHGLSVPQIERIQSKGDLLREMVVKVPFLHADGSLHDDAEDPESALHGNNTLNNRFNGNKTFDAGLVSFHPQGSPHTHSGKLISQTFVVQNLDVHRGQTVEAGDLLCELADFSTLSIRGEAFERDYQQLQQAMQSNETTSAIFADGRKMTSVDGLRIISIDNEIEINTRALHFYLRLPNKVLTTTTMDMSPTDQRQVAFPTWQYRLGQRLRLRVPIKKYEEKLILPIKAIARDGAEYYVFRLNGSQFQKVPVHVEYQDQFIAVIARGGQLRMGDYVAHTGAHQILQAIKNKSGAVDPHAGHHH